MRKKDKNLVYRFMTVQKARDLFENKWFVLVKPSAWIDPFENFISKVIFKKGKQEKKIEYLGNVYGICLTLGTETNLMWDAYTPSRNGIRLTFDLSKLESELKNQNEFPRNNFIFDKVNYVPYNDFISKLSDDNELLKLYNNQNKNILKYLFEKRREYSDEKEYRILFDANNTAHIGKNILKIPVDPLHIIEGIRFDPKMPDSECEALRQYFKRQGLDGRTIKRSLLYKYEIKKTVII